MIASPEELDALFDLVLRGHEQLRTLFYLRANPHLLLPCGFEEIRVPRPPPIVETDLLAKGPTEWSRYDDWLLKDDDLYEKLYDGQLGLNDLDYRLATTHEWSTGSSHTTNINDRGEVELKIYFSRHTVNLVPKEIALRVARAALNQPPRSKPYALILPRLWRKPSTAADFELVSSSKALLLALQEEKIGYENLTWRQLEEIVAELLRSRGMEISLTAPGADGGRDIIARGELLPGELTTLAVEVKHKRIVNIDDVRARLHANKDFPLLMFVTSGRYAAGVIEEKNRDGNYLRLILKDGVGLRQWVSDYPPW